MNTEHLCMGCMTDKGVVAVCSRCGYDEQKRRSPLVLPHRTILSKQFLVGRILVNPHGFGITYLGWDLRLETCVVVKEYLPRDLAWRDTDGTTVTPQSEEDGKLFDYNMKQFLKLARTLAKFDHASVVRVRTFFEENGTAYLVMDYYEGLSLSEYLKQKGGHISEKLAAGIMMPILDGLRDVHKKGFLHRDIKPQNIYLTKDGRPILLNFRTSKIARGEMTLSLSDVSITPGFAPYEIFRPHDKQGPWTDIYSCGATLYSMVTGKVPPDAVDRKGQDEELVPPEKIVSGISSGFSAAVMKALATEPADRFQSIREFQDALDRTPEPKPYPESESVRFRIAGSLEKLADRLTGFEYSAILILLGEEQNVKAVHLGQAAEEFDLKEKLIEDKESWIFYHAYDGPAAQWCGWKNIRRETMERIIDYKILSDEQYSEDDGFPL